MLETDQFTVELRLGGIRLTQEQRPNQYALDLPVKGQTIKTIKTDDFSLYIELGNGECLVHSQSFISGEGDVAFALDLWSKETFENAKEEWYDDDDEDLKHVSVSL